jgi:hypothetical protein
LEAMGVAQLDRRARSLQLTDFAHEVLGPEGHDRYLEDVRTLWLLHWKLASRNDGALFAWRFLLGHWPYPEFTRSEAIEAFKAHSARLGLHHSDVTLAQHLDAFLHTYYSPRDGSVGVEDSLDCPLVDLELLVPLGKRRSETTRWETVYGFRRESKPEISQSLFDHCVMDFWSRFAPNDEVLSLRAVALSPASPGEVFKLTEDDVRSRLDAPPGGDIPRCYLYQASAVQGQLFRQRDTHGPLLSDIYRQDPIDA